MSERMRDVRLAALTAAVTAVVLPLALWGVTLVVDGVALEATTVAVLTVIAVAQCLLLVLRRHHPVPVLLAIAVTQAVLLALAPADLTVRGPAPLMAAYAVATRTSPPRTVAVLAAAVGIEVVGLLVTGPGRTDPSLLLVGVANAVITYGVAALVGRYVLTHRRYVALLREEADRAVAEQEDRVRAAIAAERTRMARELHDIAAHHLSGMVVQAAAAERLVERDPDRARATIAALRRQGRQTLEDLRSLVGVLRAPDSASSVEHVGTGPAGTEGPVPGLAGVDELVDGAVALGQRVSLRRSGAPVALGPLADVTCYRVVQQALANARQHAPGSAVDVTVDHDRGGRLVVEVVNDAPADPVAGPASGSGEVRRRTPGVGIIGMAERARLVGADLDARATADGGWRVRLELPQSVAVDAEEVGR